MGGWANGQMTELIKEIKKAAKPASRVYILTVVLVVLTLILVIDRLPDIITKITNLICGL